MLIITVKRIDGGYFMKKNLSFKEELKIFKKKNSKKVKIKEK